MFNSAEGQQDPSASPPASQPASRKIEVPGELDMLFQQFTHFVRGYRNHSPASVKWYSEVYKSFRKFLLELNVARIDQSCDRLIQEWIAAARARGISPFTAKSYWQGLRPFFGYLDEMEGLPSPYRTLKPPATPSSLPKARSEEECIRILDAAYNADWANPYERARAAAMIAIALYAGLRRNEILKLKFMDVNFEEQSIRIDRGKGRGGGKDRITYMAPELQRILWSYVEERRRRRLQSVEFFTSQRSGTGVSAITLKRIVERVRQVSGVPFSLHSLRHSFVTLLLRKHVPIHVVRELAGHSDIATTARYTRVFEDDKREQLQRFTLQQRSSPGSASSS